MRNRSIPLYFIALFVPAIAHGKAGLVDDLSTLNKCEKIGEDIAYGSSKESIIVNMELRATTAGGDYFWPYWDTYEAVSVKDIYKGHKLGNQLYSAMMYIYLCDQKNDKSIEPGTAESAAPSRNPYTVNGV